MYVPKFKSNIINQKSLKIKNSSPLAIIFTLSKTTLQSPTKQNFVQEYSERNYRGYNFFYKGRDQLLIT